MPQNAVGSSGSETSSSASAVAICPGRPARVGGWRWHGCYTEASRSRTLGEKTFASDGMTLEACADFCAGHRFFGTEYSRECFCGSALNDGARKRPASECNMR